MSIDDSGPKMTDVGPSWGCEFSGNLIVRNFSGNFRKYYLKPGSHTVCNFYSKLVIFLAAVLKTSYSFLNIMHKVKTQRFGELLVKNVLIIYVYMVIVKTCKVKKII